MVSPVEGSAMAGVTGTRSRGRTLLTVASRLPRLRAFPAEAAGVKDGQIGERLDSTSQHHVGMSQPDLVGSVVDGLRGRGARPVDRVGRYAGRKLREQADFAGHIGCQHGGNYLAEHHLVDFPPVDLAPEQQLTRRMAR
jgi:hypothetical protein